MRSGGSEGARQPGRIPLELPAGWANHSEQLAPAERCPSQVRHAQATFKTLRQLLNRCIVKEPLHSWTHEDLESGPSTKVVLELQSPVLRASLHVQRVFNEGFDNFYGGLQDERVGGDEQVAEGGGLHLRGPHHLLRLHAGGTHKTVASIAFTGMPTIEVLTCRTLQPACHQILCLMRTASWPLPRL